MASEANGQRQMDFTPVDYDGETIPPEAPAGEWEAVCEVKKSKTSKDGFPMLILNWKLEATDEPDNQSYIGQTVSDFIVFWPEGHKASRSSKQRLHRVCAHMKIELSDLPKGRMESWDDAQALVDGLDGQRAQIWTYLKTDKDSGEDRTNIAYSAPGGSFSSSEEEEEEVAAAPKGKGKAAAPAKGKAAPAAKGKGARR